MWLCNNRLYVLLLNTIVFCNETVKWSEKVLYIAQEVEEGKKESTIKREIQLEGNCGITGLTTFGQLNKKGATSCSSCSSGFYFQLGMNGINDCLYMITFTY